MSSTTIKTKINLICIIDLNMKTIKKSKICKTSRNTEEYL